MSANSTKGYNGEAPVCRLLAHYTAPGKPEPYRPRAGAPRDRGDIGNVPMVQSCKNWKTWAPGTWVDEMTEQVANAGMETGVVWQHRRGRANPMDWYVITTGELYLPMYLAYQYTVDQLGMPVLPKLTDWGPL